MMKRILIPFLLTMILACGGGGGSNDFQQNEAPGFQLAEITEGYGAMDDAWNSIDTNEFNERLKRAVDEKRTEDDDPHENFEISSYGFADVLEHDDEPLAELVREDLQSIITRLVDTQNRHLPKRDVDAVYTGSAEIYNDAFYAFLDRVSGEGFEAPPDYITGAIKKVLDYVLDDNLPDDENGNPDKAWLNEKVQELVDDLVEDDPVERDFKDDFIDLSKLITKATIQTDYPVWIDDAGNPLNYEEINPSQHTNLDMGNAVKGSHDVVMWLNKLIMNPDTRVLLRQAMLDFDSILNPDPEAGLVEKLKTLVENLEANFTTGGEVYEANPIYSQDDNATFSDSEMGQLIRDSSPMIQQLFTRSDRPQSMIVTKEGEGPVYPLDFMNANLRNIGFNPDTIDVERSIYDLMRYDLWGRDRMTNENAFPASHLESLLFLTQVTANFGWQDGGTTGEYITNIGRHSSSVEHGHGAYVEELTLNDALYSMHMLKLYGTLGVYQIGLYPMNGDHLYRTRSAFALSDVDQLHTLDSAVFNDATEQIDYTYQLPSAQITGDDKDYRFFYDQNYGVLQFLAGPGPGDLGTPNGGNPNGNNLTTNQYRAYAPNGLGEKQMAAWTMGWGVRACFNGEGPYYYADPNAATVSVNGQAYRQYLRPNGKTYALVSLDGAQYLYPAEDGDVEDTETAQISFNGKRQRDNRYKAQWHSDYYMAHVASYPDNQNRYFTIDNSSGISQLVPADATAEVPNPQAGRLLYNELVAETDSIRACASPEEAFFRNFQWVMNEKKMVLIIPFYMWIDESMKAIVFQVLECHGWSGLANARKLSDAHNHVWAKAGGMGTSNIPGDYRFEITTAAADADSASEINDVSVFTETIDCGNATPAIVGHNLPALFRLAFPRSIEPPSSFNDGVLGSREFQVGDDNWNNRNAVVPLLFSLLAGLRDHSPDYDPNNRPGINSGMRAFLNQGSALIKPLFYYNRAGATMPVQSYTPRVYGTNAITDRHQGFPFLKSSADFYTGTPTTWYGSAAEQRFYQPAVMKSFLNVMIDSDVTDPQKRMDGLLPLVTDTRALSNLLKVLLDPSVEAPPLEQILTATKFTMGGMTRINGSPESGKGMVFPQWMFATGVEETRDPFGAYTEYAGVRDDDIFLDDLLDRIVGRDALDADTDGYGLANYPDKQERLALDPNASEAPWEEFSDNVDTLADLLHESSPYCISTNLLDAIERVFAREEAYTSEEIYGMLYATGKVFGRYDSPTERWIYQGEEQNFQDIYNMLATRVPVMNSAVIETESANPAALGGPPGHYGLGDHYYSQLVLMSKMSDPDGLMEYIFNTITSPQNWDVIMHDLNRFMHGYDISNDNSELWSTLAELLQDMGSAVGRSNESDVIDAIIEDYGFQVNR
ncbi:MAG: hypothetical protein HY911_02040 [Desulfobacterales bacterium]|nr:hypothetical protein [Desulfobacterales bacterium]